MKRNIWPTIGLIAGLIVIIWSIKTAGEDVSFIDIPSILITFVGSFCALLISIPFKSIVKIPSVLKTLVFMPKDDRVSIIQLFVDLSNKARQNGLLSLEDDIAELNNELLTTGLQMVVDGVEPDRIRGILELELDSIERRHRIGQDVFNKWGELAPGFGMLGTLIGLIIMLSRLDDPSSIGTGMATALITTFYGSLAANLLFLPIASNLQYQTDEEIYTGELIIDGILEIQAGSNPRLIEEKLITYLSPVERVSLENNPEHLKEARSYE
ncbi:MAG: motility protein A [Tissierellaceae bacterium]|nr:motility protein A [Tissierellaceae bacterium]